MMDLPLKKVLYRLDLVGQLTMWSIKLFEYEVSFKVRKALKTQLFADFLVEMTPVPLEPDYTWVVLTYGSSNSQRSGANVILENNTSLVVEVFMRFEFPTTNDQAEFEVVITRIMLVEEMGSKASNYQQTPIWLFPR